MFAHDAKPGQALVELVLILPLMLLLLVGAVDLSRVFYTYVGMVNAAREAASFAMFEQDPPLVPPTHSAVTDRAIAELGGAAGFTVTFSCASEPCVDDGQPVGNTVTVTVSTDFSFIMPLLPTWELSAASTAVIQGES